MLPELAQLPTDHRSGFIAVIGRPNVGKSTLFNRLLEQKIAITSPKPQTTRDQLMGIYTTEKVQAIFLDTPGIHTPKHKLGEYMMFVVDETIGDADVLLWLVDLNVPPKEEDRQIATLLCELHRKQPFAHLVLGFNKLDQNKQTEQVRSERVAEYLALVYEMTPSSPVVDGSSRSESSESPEQSRVTSILFSALTGEGVETLLTHLTNLLPFGPRYYPEEQVTDLQVRFIAEELIREKALELLEQEVPHSIAVTIDEFSRRNEEMTYISAVLYVERDSQKRIVLGRKGAMIKKIGQAARPEIEELVETKVYLDLWVKVWEKWRKRSGMLRQLGYVE
ncbi:GTPase Era [Chloroflexi bacterium TSY]|nr:GTPase Era [Chloroflexi bacterium TSY]